MVNSESWRVHSLSDMDVLTSRVALGTSYIILYYFNITHNSEDNGIILRNTPQNKANILPLQSRLPIAYLSITIILWAVFVGNYFLNGVFLKIFLRSRVYFLILKVLIEGMWPSSAYPYPHVRYWPLGSDCNAYITSPGALLKLMDLNRGFEATLATPSEYSIYQRVAINMADVPENAPEGEQLFLFD